MMRNEKDRELSMIVWLILAGTLAWLASVGVGLHSCSPERDEMDGPVPAVSHAAGWLRATP